MANLIGFTSVDRILAKSYRELKETDLDENDVIEWIGEAMDFMAMPEVQEEAVIFLEVNNFETELPKGFQAVLQIALLDDAIAEHEFNTPGKAVDDSHIPRPDITPIREDSCNPQCYKPYFDMSMNYIEWTTSMNYRKFFTPIRLANHTFFNDIVCKENSMYQDYNSCTEEYTIVGTTERKLRFSFKEGLIALSYIRAAVDPETGYPLVPDSIQHITAISYYIKWKIAEYFSWTRRDGFDGLSDKAEAKWLKYVKQAKNFAKMPKTIDQYQNLLEQTHQLIPNHRRYYNNFGKLGRVENKKFNDPNYRNKY